MGSINVLIIRHIGEKYIKEISDLDPRLYLIDRSDPNNRSGYLLLDKDEIISDYEKAEIILAYRIPPNLIDLAPNLKWLQLTSAGFEHLDKSILKSKIKITNSASIHGIMMAEHVAMVMLMFTRRATDLIKNKENHSWVFYLPQELWGKTIGIIGLGHIGLEVANIAKAFGMKILVTDIIFPRLTRGVAGIDAMYPSHLMNEMLSRCDFVIIAVPYTKKTEGMIGEIEMKAMKKSAYLINVSRGPIVDEIALIKALEEGWIAGAGLDVFQIEPLPYDNRLWDFPNVIISPHIAGESDQYEKRVTDLFRDNLLRYLNIENLLNIVN